MLNHKWFLFNNKVNFYTNFSAPANHYYISTLNPSIYINSTNFFTPLDITAVDNKTQTNVDLIFNDFDKNSINHLLWSDTVVNDFSLNLQGLSWSLREVKEFFGLNSLQVNDARNLLLDYSVNTNPLKKIFPTQGLEEVYFNFYTQQVCFVNANFIEL